LSDEAVTEIMVNDGGSRIFIERQGRIEQLSGVRIETVSLTAAIKNIFRVNGLEISESQPARDARLEDGSRVTAVLSPISVSGPILTIRRHPRLFSLAQLVDAGMLTSFASGLLSAAVNEGANVLISGRTGSGKTTLLNALAATLPDHDRILLIEAPAEIAICKPNLVRLEARLEEVPLGQETPLPPVSIGQLVRTALRLRRRCLGTAPVLEQRPLGFSVDDPCQLRRARHHAVRALCIDGANESSSVRHPAGSR
jgi:pilus assembly protein CpaF